MYTRGLGRYRGLGQAPLSLSVDDAGNLISTDQTGVNQMIANPLTMSQLASLSASNAAFFNQPTMTTGAGVTKFLNTNATAVMIGAGLFILLAAMKR